MFGSVLVANRGEIACRIIRTARALGLRTVAVHSHPDRHALHVEMADEAVDLGGARAAESYLDAKAVLAAARSTGAQCIHPGYGFLAENAGFAEACAAQGVAFVGPPASAIRAMGRKDDAKALARDAGVPVLPGYEGDLTDAEALVAAVAAIGYPVMVKAVAGGGGTGMRRVASASELADAIEAARREAISSFGDARLIVEKCLDRPRHIEVQVLADAHGNCVHLFERDCSLQRRRQKVIEEAPAPGMTEGLRRRMTDAALRAARAVGYVGAGTVEFLVEDGELHDNSPFHFLEMNTRLQVEHPVTEAITSLDLVEWQFRVAAGELLGFSQDDIRLKGHALEARVYCEDPSRGFLPASGKLYLVRWPEGEGVRVDAGVRTGDAVSPYYDPMLAKVVCYAQDREAAIAGLRAALEQTAIAGPRTNLAFLHDLLGKAEVAGGRADTGFIERVAAMSGIRQTNRRAVEEGIKAILRRRSERIAERARPANGGVPSPWDARDGFALGPRPPVPMRFMVDGEGVVAEVVWNADGICVSLPDAFGREAADGDFEIVMGEVDSAFVLSGLVQTEVALASVEGPDSAAMAGDGVIRAPMHGRVTAVRAAAGDEVEVGAALVMLEAMKMEHRLVAPHAGRVTEIAVVEGQQVSAGDLVAVVKAEKHA